MQNCHFSIHYSIDTAKDPNNLDEFFIDIKISKIDVLHENHVVFSKKISIGPFLKIEQAYEEGSIENLIKIAIDKFMKPEESIEIVKCNMVKTIKNGLHKYLHDEGLL
jgi:hypothetical protein